MSQYEASEAVARGHPDKVADQISDAILDALLQQDPFSRVAIEAIVSHQMIAVGGEVTSQTHINVDEIIREVISQIGYADPTFGSPVSDRNIICSISQQSPDIAQGVGSREELFSSICAGDQGMMFGFATLDTATFMPKSYEMARAIVNKIECLRASDSSSIFGPDGKTEVALKNGAASIIVSWQHRNDAKIDDVREQLTQIVTEVTAPFSVRIENLLANPAGRFVLGGPLADTGLTGRKQIVDSYGGSVHHGGGSFSGKDATKVDRSGAYMARYMAKHVVAAGLASKCETQLVFSIGEQKPLCLGINCFGTEKLPEDRIEKALRKVFPLTVSGIINELDLTKPIFQQTAFGGHFGRAEFSWEQLPRIEEIKKVVCVIQ